MTKEELKRLSDDTFFDNDTGEIQPEAHRRFNDKMIDHTDTVAEATLRNSRDYTDTRETAILAAADTKDADTLRTAKEYSDRIVAALAGSAPDLLNTLEELATALNNDPNFSATVMQMIGERVTTEALNQALAGKADTNGNVSEEFYAIRLFLDKDKVKGVVGGDYSSALAPDDVYLCNWRHDKGAAGLISKEDPYFLRVGEWIKRTIWHSGNFNPATKMPLGDYTGDLNAVEGSGVFRLTGDQSNAPFSGSGTGSTLVQYKWDSRAAFQIYYRFLSNEVYMREKTGGFWGSWVKFYHSGNLKPTYYAQIDPNGNVVGQVGDWIQSVAWVDNGNGYTCQ